MILLRIFLFVFIGSALVFGWGREGHSLINKKAIELLAKENPAFENWKVYLTSHASDPDNRRDQDSTEFPKHFIDVDFYSEFQSGKMITHKSQLINKYGDSIVTQMGILPWATVESFEGLKKAFMENNRDKVLIFAVDLAHYISDGHNPMHTMLNYNGQLSGQNGIHSRYESNMIRKYLSQFDEDVKGDEIKIIDNRLEYIFNYISNSHYLGPVLFSADKISYEITNTVTGDDYLYLLYQKTKYVTELQMENSTEAIASLIYTAWKEAGEPPLENLN